MKVCEFIKFYNYSYKEFSLFENFVLDFLCYHTISFHKSSSGDFFIGINNYFVMKENNDLYMALKPLGLPKYKEGKMSFLYLNIFDVIENIKMRQDNVIKFRLFSNKEIIYCLTNSEEFWKINNE